MNRYPANFRRRSGVVELSSNFIIFRSDDGAETYEILAHQLKIETGGSNRPQVQLFNHAAPTEIISTSHIALLHSLKNLGYVGVDTKITQLKRKGGYRKGMIGATALILVLFLVGIPLIARLLPSSFLDQMISRQKERALIQSLPDSFGGLSFKKPPAALDEKVARLVFWLQAQSKILKEIPIEVFVSADQEVNAYAYPGDKIVLNEGLIRESDDIEMLAGVLAHELGHIEKRHNLKAIGSSLSYLAGAALLSSIIGVDGAGFLLHGVQFTTLKYSRDHEREADESAVQILAQAGLSPEGLVRFFQKLKQKEVIGSSSTLNLFSTHPMNDERIARLRMKAAGLPPFNRELQLPVTLEEIKSHLDGEQ